MENKRINEDTKDKKRSFTQRDKDLCWNKSQIMLGRDPKRWRLDAFGNPVIKQLKGCFGDFCHEYDHIVPFSKGGKTNYENCQILKTSVNRFKSNKEDIKFSEYTKFRNSKIYTEDELDFIETTIYGNISRVKLSDYLNNN